MKHCLINRTALALALSLLVLTGCNNGDDPGKSQASPQPTVGAPEPASSAPQAQPADETPDHTEVFERPTGDLVEIGEKLFIAQTNDIYLNPEDYIGKTLKYEGIYQNQVWQGDTTEEIHYVIRYGPGCCGFDDNAGFEVMWDGEYPETDDWVEVVGVLQKVVIDEEYDYYYLVLELDSLTVLDERGAEYVNS